MDNYRKIHHNKRNMHKQRLKCWVFTWEPYYAEGVKTVISKQRKKSTNDDTFSYVAFSVSAVTFHMLAVALMEIIEAVTTANKSQVHCVVKLLTGGVSIPEMHMHCLEIQLNETPIFKSWPWVKYYQLGWQAKQIIWVKGLSG